MNIYKPAKAVAGAVFRPLYRPIVEGADLVPEQGGVLLCCNHISNLDPVLLGISVERDVHFMAKEELFQGAFLKSAFQGLQAFPVRRGMADREALKAGLSLLRAGKVIGLYPEGTRSRTGEVGEGMAGAGFFALKGNCAVVPCAIDGPYQVGKRVRLRIGAPLHIEPLRERKATADEATAFIMTSIRSLLGDMRRR